MCMALAQPAYAQDAEEGTDAPVEEDAGGLLFRRIEADAVVVDQHRLPLILRPLLPAEVQGDGAVHEFTGLADNLVEVIGLDDPVV
mgnify:CR=1 FL=1